MRSRIKKVPNAADQRNWVRAAVLGADDGIVSTAGIVVGVAGATSDFKVILTAGVAGLLAGALSMAAGEYVSVSSQRDSEKVTLEKEKQELANDPKGEFKELTGMYEQRGLKHSTAVEAAKELTAHDVFRAHVELEYKIDPEHLTNPWHAAIASAASFTVGAIIPLGVILLPPPAWRFPVTFGSVIVALALSGYLSAKFGDAYKLRATLRVVFGGALAMIITYGIGRLLGVSAF